MKKKNLSDAQPGCNPPLKVRVTFYTFLNPLTKFDGLICKIKSFGISDTTLKLIENFLSNRYQRVVLNG